MEKAKKFLQITPVETQSLSQHLPPLTPDSNFCFYKQFILRGIHVDQIEPGLVVCTFKGPPRFTDRTGKLSRGSIANLVDELGGAVAHTEGFPMNVSVDMSISFLSTAHVNVKLQKHNTKAHGIQYRSGLHCTARIMKTEGVTIILDLSTCSWVSFVRVKLWLHVFLRTRVLILLTSARKLFAWLVRMQTV